MEDIKYKQAYPLNNDLIAQPSLTFPILNLITLAIIFAKIEDSLFIAWWVTFIPTFIYIFLQIVFHTKALLVTEENLGGYS